MKCEVKKDDIGGTKPYHANVVYPRKQTKDPEDMEYANRLSLEAEFIPINPDFFS